MNDFYLLNLQDYHNPIPAKEIFGKDTKRLLDACGIVMNSAFHEYEGCYYSPYRPRLRRLKETANEEGITILQAKAEWEINHPEEMEKENKSRKEWEENVAKQFRIIYGIVKRHHVFLRWEGKGCACEPDRWTIFKKNKEIARICMI